MNPHPRSALRPTSARAALRRGLPALALLALVLPPPLLQAQGDSTWTGLSGTDWFDASNWSSGVPVSGIHTIGNNGNYKSGTAVISVGTGTAGTFSIGYGNGAGQLGMLILNGTGMLNSGVAYIGRENGSSLGNGAVYISGSAFWKSSSDISVARSGSVSTGYLEISESGSLQSTALHAGYQNATSGTILITDNARVTTGGTHSYIGGQANATTQGHVTISGSGYWTNTTTSHTIYVGNYGAGTLILEQSGSLRNNRTNADNVNVGMVIGNQNTGKGTVIVRGTADLTIANEGIAVGNNGHGTLTIEDEATVNATRILLAFASTGTGILNLHGGVLATRWIDHRTGTGTVNFDGGILRATTNDSAFIRSTTPGRLTLTSTGAGAFIDSGSFTISTSLAFAGDGGLTKLGEGIFSLFTVQTYTGTTTVSGGTLSIGGLSADNILVNSAAIHIADGAVLMAHRLQTLNNLSGGGDIAPANSVGDQDAHIVLNSTADTVFSGSFVSSSHLMEKTGAGALTFSNTGDGIFGIVHNLALNEGALVFASGTFLITETATIAAGGTLGITAGAGVLLGSTTSSFTFASGAVLDILGAVTGPTTLIVSGSAFTASDIQNNVTLLNNGAGNKVSHDIYSLYYLTLANSDRSLQVNSSLLWNSTAGESHGTFNIAAGAAFDPGISLTNRAGPDFTPFDNWDGKSLTKTGAGLLTLSTAAAYTGTTTVTAGTLALAAADAIASSTAVFIGDGAVIAATGTQTLQNLAGDGGTLATQDNSSLLILDSSFDTDFAGVLTGAGALEKTGPATLTLSAAAAHTGATTISAGTLALTAADAIASSTAVFIDDGAVIAATGTQTLQNLAGSGTLQGAAAPNSSLIILNSSFATAYDGIIAGAGALEKTGLATLTLSASHTFTGGATVTDGTLALNAADALRSASAVTIDAGAALTSGAAQTLRNLAGAGSLALAGAVPLTLENTVASAYAGTLAAPSAAIAKTGAGVLSFSGTGDAQSLSITDGSFDVFGSGSLALSGTLDLAATATLGITAGSAKITTGTAAFAPGSVINIRGDDGSTGSVTLIQSETPITDPLPALLSSGNPIDMSLEISSIYSLLYNTGSTAVLVDTVLVWTNPGQAHGTFHANDSPLTVTTTLANRADGSFTAFDGWDGKTLTKTGSDTLILAAQNTYTGTTLVKAGTLALTAADAIASSTAVAISDGAVITATGTQTLRNLTGSGTLQGAAAPNSIIVNSSFSTTFAGAFTGGGGVAKTGAGTLTLAGASTHTGGFTVNDGRLIAQNAAAPGTGTLTINAAATVEFNLAPAATGTFAGAVAGTGTFLKTGAGALTLTGPASAAGALAIDAGTLALGAGAKLAIGGAATLADNSALSFIIGDDTGPALTAGTLDIGRNVALNIAGIAGTGTGVRFTLIDTAAGITGTFNPVTIGTGIDNPDYLSYSAAKSADGKTYTIDAALSWNRTDGSQSGTFTLGPGAEFILDVALANNTATGANGWDSASLIKDGDGTLILNAKNTYTGATVINGGTLILATADAIAYSATIAIADGAVLFATGAQTLQNLAGDGTFLLNAGMKINSTADTTFAGLITGTGALQKIGTGTLTFTTTLNTYEGGIDIDNGTLRVPAIATLGDGAPADGADAVADAIARSATIAIAPNATLEIAPDLAGGAATLTGTLGIITTTAGGTTTRVRTLDGKGTLQLTATAGTLTLNNDNPGFAGAIALADGLTKVVSTTTTTVTETTAITGTLLRTITTATTTEYLRAGEVFSSTIATITGTDYIAGTIPSSTVRPVVTTTTGLGATLRATTAGAFGAGAVTIGEGSAILYSGVTGTSFAAHNGIATRTGTDTLVAPELRLETSTLTLAAAGEGVERVVLNPASALTLAHPRALGDGVAKANLDAGSSLLFAAGHARLAAVSMTGGTATLGFAAPAAPAPAAALAAAGAGAFAGAGAAPAFAAAPAPAATPAFATAEIGTLAGTGAGNKLAFHVDLSSAVTGVNPAGAVGNHLRVTGSFSGSYAVTVNNTGTLQPGDWPAEHGVSVELLRTATPTALNALALAAGSRIEAGLVAYELKQGDGTGLLPDPKAWYLADTGVSRVADVIFNTAALAGEDWHYALDSLHLRLGDLRATGLPSTTPLPKADRWMRFRSYQLDGDSTLSGVPFTQYAFGLTVGADRLVRLENATLAIGALLETGIVTRRFDGGGEGESRSFGAGAYAAWHHAAGWFADTVLKVDNYNNTLGGATSYSEVNNASYNTYGLGLGAELGRRIESADGWWIEASVQGALLHIGSAGYDTRPGGLLLHIEADAATSLQYRGQVRFGHQFRDTKLHPYARAGAARSETSGGVIHASYLSRKPAYEFGRAEFGAGFIYRNTPRSQFYFDYEYASATYYTRPWSVNLGYRRAW